MAQPTATPEAVQTPDPLRELIISLPPLSSESTDHSPRWLKIGNPILVFCENLVDDL